MTITAQQIKELRDKTGVSMMSCKKALESAGGDTGKALELLREESEKIADKKSERVLKSGLVDAYIHGAGQTGVLLEVGCETDFVARNEEFRRFVHNIAMHIAAMNPAGVDGLLSQQYIKNPDITIGDYIKEVIQKFGENVEVARFTRYG